MNDDLELSARDINESFMLKVGGILIALLLGVAAMWFLNIIGLQAANLIPFFLGLIWLVVVGSSPAAIGLSAFTGSIVRLANLKNPLSGTDDGIRFWLTVILPAAILTFCFLAGFLATWPFQKNPIGFWYVAAFTIVATTASIVYKKNSDLPFKIVMTYSLVVIIISLVNSFFSFDTSTLSKQVPAIDGTLLEWWPLGLIIVLVALTRVKEVKSLATMGITVVALVWIVTSAPKLFGDTFDNFTLFGQAKPNPCAFQNNLVVPEGSEGLRVTICSQHLEYANIMSVQRNGPRPVKVVFADSTLALYGDQLRTRNAEEFLTLREAGCLGQNFCLKVEPNNDEFYKLGLHLVPLDFRIKYAISDVPD